MEAAGLQNLAWTVFDSLRVGFILTYGGMANTSDFGSEDSQFESEYVYYYMLDLAH